MSYYCESLSKDNISKVEEGIHHGSRYHHAASKPSSSLHQQVNAESLLHSRACCKLLLLWSMLTTLASLVSVYYAIDVHNSLVLKKELTNVILSRDFPIVNQRGLEGFQRPR